MAWHRAARAGEGWKKHESKPELSSLLEDNFIQYDGVGEVPPQIHSYLSTNHKDLRGLEKSDPRLVAKAKDRWYVPDPNKAQDLEKKREKALLKEFDQYRAFTGRRLKEFRLEALRAGFRAAWGNKDYQTIIDSQEQQGRDVGGPAYVAGRDGVDLEPLAPEQDTTARLAAQKLFEQIEQNAG